MFREYLKTKKRNSFCSRFGISAFFMQGQAKSFQPFENFFPPAQQLTFAIAVQKEIIHIAQVACAAQLAFDKLIERIKITIRPPLGCEIANWQTARR